MPPAALADVLKDFGAAPELRAEVSFFEAEDGGADFAMPPADEGPDVDALIAAAVEQAEAALTERLNAEHAQALEEVRGRHEDELAALASRMGEEASAAIATRMGEMEERVVDLTTSLTARILGIALTEDVRERSVARLAGIIRDALRDGEAMRIRVRGPLSLYEALKNALPNHAGQFDFDEDSSVDMAVTIDESVFETRLADWSRALSEALS